MGETTGQELLPENGAARSSNGIAALIQEIQDARDAVDVVSIDALLPAHSPRLGGEDDEHVRMLAEAIEDLPPILVHRPTMRVIDGMHRLKAAMRQGFQTIRVKFIEGTDMDCFVISVRTNIQHGLPLSLADRRAAASRILAAREHWSDRSIAALTGLAPKTVGGIRRRQLGERGQAGARLGRDGKVRPVSSATGRQMVSELLTEHPDMSLRQAAAAAGVSRATARDVRRRMERGDLPFTGSPVDGPASSARSEADWLPQTGPERQLAAGAWFGTDRKAILDNLAKDPSLRFSEPGRALVRWLAGQSLGLQDWPEFVESIPPHCSYLLVDLAHACAADWLSFARRLEQRVE